jgi:hypothetical protein
MKEKRYLACAIDCEGSICFLVQHYHTKKGLHFYCQPCVKITNTNKAWLEYCKTLAKMGSVVSSGTSSKVVCQGKIKELKDYKSYQLQITSLEEVIKFLEEVQNDLFIKKDKAIWTIEFCKSRLARRKLGKKNKPYSERELELVHLVSNVKT